MGSKADDISQRIRSGRLLVLTPEEAGEVVQQADLIEKHGTPGKGDLMILSWLGMRIVLEQENDETFIARRFSDQREVDPFVERRLNQYERMWDGCGCRIDYYEEL
jgi:hypothetical protein